MNMNNVYKLNGFLNLFNIVPDFVIPIFLRNDEESYYFAQYNNGDSLSFEEFPLYKYDNKLYYKLSNPNIYFRDLNPFNYARIFTAKRMSRKHPYRYEFINQSMAIFAFHDEKGIVYGELSFFLKYINSFITEDKYLIEQINDFKECIKLMIEKNKKEIVKCQLTEVSKVDKKPLFFAPKVDLLGLNFNQMSIANTVFPINPILNSYKLIEMFDKELKKYSFNSIEYKKIIGILYLLLYKNDNNKNRDKDFETNILKNIDTILSNINND